jgi:hypothetical protein
MSLDTVSDSADYIQCACRVLESGEEQLAEPVVFPARLEQRQQLVCMCILWSCGFWSLLGCSTVIVAMVLVMIVIVIMGPMSMTMASVPLIMRVFVAVVIVVIVAME